MIEKIILEGTPDSLKTGGEKINNFMVDTSNSIPSIDNQSTIADKKINIYDSTQNTVGRLNTVYGTDLDHDISKVTAYMKAKGKVIIIKHKFTSATQSFIFAYKEPGRTGVRINHTYTGDTVEFDMPEGYPYFRLNAVSTVGTVYLPPTAEILKEVKNEDILRDYYLDEYFIKSADFGDEFINVYNPNSNHKDNRLNTTTGQLYPDVNYTATDLIKIKTKVEISDASLQTDDKLYIFLFQDEKLNGIRLDASQYTRTATGITFDVPSGYNYMRTLVNNPTNTYLTDNSQIKTFANKIDIIRTMPLSSIGGTLGSDLKQNLIQIFPKITGIGDSLMAGYTSKNGETINSATAAQTKNNWLGYISLRNGNTVTNLAVGGSTTEDWRNTHINNANVPTDLYFIGLGVNDLRSSKTIGTSADIHPTDYNQNAVSFFGNLDYIINTVKGYNPKAHTFIFTIPRSETNAVNYNKAVNHVAGLHERVHVIDLENKAEYTTGIFEAENNGHYNPLVYNMMSVLIENEVNQYIHENYSKFNGVPYN